LWINEGRSLSGLDHYETQAIFKSTRKVNFGLVVRDIESLNGSAGFDLDGSGRCWHREQSDDGCHQDFCELHGGFQM